MTHLIVTIDGASATGKTSLCRALAQKLGLWPLNSGVLYRRIACLAVEAKLGITDREKILEIIDKNYDRIKYGLQHQVHPKKGLSPPSEPGLQEEAIGQLASMFSALPYVRDKVTTMQRQLAEEYDGKGVVLEGRDAGTVVFPDAPIKLFLTASPEVRVRRRQLELGIPDGSEALAKLRESMLARDARDGNRAFAPLIRPEGSIPLDTSAVTMDQLAELTVKLVYERSGH